MGAEARATPANYRYYRFTPDRLRNAGASSVQLAEFELSLGGVPTAAPVATNPGGSNPGGETPPRAVDGDLDTKWLDFNGGPLVLDFGAPEPVDGYRWATANDAPDRDPLRWTLEGSDDNLSWTLLDDRTDADYPTPVDRFTFIPLLELNQLPEGPAIQFTASDGAVTSHRAIGIPGGATVTLAWDVLDSTAVMLDAGTGPQPVAASGTTTDQPAGDQTYVLAATNAAGISSATVTVYVGVSVLPPVINEILADGTGDGALRDEDGDASDWVELHNPNAFAIGVGGYFLTDDELLATRWLIPAGTQIDPADYLVLFASGKDRAVAGAELHTDFSISRNGEYLGLIAPDGFTVTDQYAPTFPPQFTDVSYGRVPPVSGNTFDYFTAPTPGFANDTVPGPPGEDVEFVTPAQTFVGSIQVVLSVTSTTAVIRYTTDGSLPGETSAIYTGAIPLANSALVSARTYDPGRAPGAIKAEAFIALDPGLVSQTSDLPIVILENFGAGAVPTGRDLQPAYLTLHEPDLVTGRTDLSGLPVDANRAGIKRRGSSTLNDPKGNYRVEFWRDDSEQDKNINLLGLSDHDEWILFAPYTFDRSLVRIPFIHTVSNAIGTYASKTRFCEVYLNTAGDTVGPEDYQGIYVLMERVARDANRVDIERLDEFDLAEPEITGGYILGIDRLDPEDQGFRSTLGHPEDPAIASPQPFFTYVYPKEQNIQQAQANYIRAYIDDLEAALYGPDFTDPDLGYAAWLDADASIDHHILCTFSKNPDALRLSTHLYKPRGGKLAFGPIWDFDRTMGCDADGRAADPVGWDPPSETTLFFEYDYWGRLFQDPDFMQKWIDRWQGLRDAEFSNSNMQARVDGLAGEVAESQPRNAATWPEVAPNGGALSTLGGWPGEVDHLKHWLTQRAEWIDTQFTPHPILQAGGAVSAGTTVTAQPVTGTMYYTADGADPRLPGGGIHPNAIAIGGAESTNLTLVSESSAPIEALRPTSPSPGPTAWTVIGFIASRAIGGPGIRIDATTIITARALDGTDWSGPVQANFIVGVPASSNNLVVAEMMYHPPDPTPAETLAGFTDPSDFEFLELQNVSGETIDLTGVTISAALDFAFNNSLLTVLAPGDVILLVRKTAAFEARYGTGRPIAGEWGDPEDPDGGLQLSNGGEQVVITGAAGSLILDFTYDDGAGWPQGADGLGPSMVLNSPVSLPDHGIGANWHDSLAPRGSPGTGHDDLYEEWQALHFTPAQLADPAVSGIQADPDADGRKNLLELVLATNPWTPSPENGLTGAVRPIDVSGQLDHYFTVTLTLHVPLPGIAVATQFSDDLLDWTDAGVEAGAIDNLDGTKTVTYRDIAPTTAAPRHARISAERL